MLKDEARTTANLVGNCLATAVMTRWEGERVIPPEGAVAEAPVLVLGVPAAEGAVALEPVRTEG